MRAEAEERSDNYGILIGQKKMVPKLKRQPRADLYHKTTLLMDHLLTNLCPPFAQATESELHSILKGAPKAVKDVLASDYSTAMRPQDYEEAAWFAAYSGDLGELLTVKDGGYSVDACLDRRASTPFYIACATGRLEVAEYLASTPGLVEVNSQNHTGATPFFAACVGGHAKIAKYLAGKRRGDDFAVDIEVSGAISRCAHVCM
jgi:hypothetical protein